MNDRAITAAALRWHTAHAKRLAIGAQKRQWDKAAKEAGSVFSRAFTEAGAAATRLTAAKRTEQAALRALAKACAKERRDRDQIEDAVIVIDA